MGIYTHKALDLLEKHQLDAAIAEKFLGWKLEDDPEKSSCKRWFDENGKPTKYGTGCGMKLFHPSEDLNIAFPEIIERLKESNLTITCTVACDIYTCGIYNDKQREMAHWYDETLGVAICKAALKLLIRKAKKESPQ
ncbi:hypothetical protein KI809_13520 [Geobacter pelophilus]|jgi:hypothetical protein|uniref:Phage ABA sandwich domain-containing protein n=1 Tax=Geoanaerobacter pelophilus TaxID=60036 RepID=A0AAW4L9T9_9BACT|nr:hypothetical protein [Geoanaerobacter pelophilus]MBT0665320.1 hypothetical protein [Geoanaerobacter pelophilus]